MSVPNIDSILPAPYTTEDCHVFVANSNPVNVPIPTNTTPVFIAVDGVEQIYHTQVKGKSFNNSTIHAIFDWDNSGLEKTNWFSDILQFGLNEDTGERNQLKDGYYAFGWMSANPAVIANLDISNLTNMRDMFRYASNFNLDISEWDVSNVTNMYGMFSYASSFNQDLSQWCVSNIAWKPTEFDLSSGFAGDSEKQPQWGECPELSGGNQNNDDFQVKSYLGDYPFFDAETLFPIVIDGVFYIEKDAHIFVANENEINFAMPRNTNPIFVAVDGVEKNYATEVKGKAFPDSTIHAIFDWSNQSLARHAWFSDILQIGSRSVGDEPEGYENPTPLPSRRIPNQLKSGAYAFYGMSAANPAVISDLDTSNLISTTYMFEGLTPFNQDLSKWDTSNVTFMGGMFYNARSFNGDVSTWDTSKVTNMGSMFNGAYGFNQDLSKWDTSNVTDMSSMFYTAMVFNGDVSTWDTSKVTMMPSMFVAAIPFNQDISGWDVSNVTWMSSMFDGASSFDQDLSEWCVSQFDEMPDNFDKGATAWEEDKKPVWGTCPRWEIIPDGYELEDCHILVANGNTVKLPISSRDEDNCPAVFVAVDGVEVTPTYAKSTHTLENGYEINETYWTVPAEANQIVYIIDGWNNYNVYGLGNRMTWISDILQFGLNPKTGKRNQLENGFAAFCGIDGNPAAIANLDVSNVTNMQYMFGDAFKFNQDIGGWDTSNVFYPGMLAMFVSARSFDQDISGWDTSKVSDMQNMFLDASSFNQDLSQWCVSQFSGKPYNFDNGAGFEGQTAKHPQWGECPRWEHILDGYELADCHIFVANENMLSLPLASGTSPEVVIVDGVKRDYSSIQNGRFPGSTIHAIFDWDNTRGYNHDFYSDILQFGSRSVGDEPEGYVNPPALASGRIPNQLKKGKHAFRSMKANPAVISDLDVSNLTDMGYIFYYAGDFNQDLSKWDVSNVINMERMFYNVYSFNSDISKWDVSKVWDMSYMFYNAQAFSADIGGWNTSSSEDMGYMFYQAQSFNPPVLNWNTSNVTTMFSMFAGTEKFNSDISSWDTKNVKSMKLMFQNTWVFNSDISRWNTSSVTNMNSMFANAAKFNRNISGWNTSKVTSMGSMFYGAFTFNQNLSQWCVSNITSKPGSFDLEARAWAGGDATRPQWGTCPRGEDKLP